MNMFVSSFMFVGLLTVALAHFVWALGRTWPIRDEKLLAQTVVGTPGVERMPPRYISFIIALLALAAGIFTLALADHDSGGNLMNISGIGLGLLFLARGIAGYTAWWAAQFPEPIFRLNDRRVYSPLCLFLGVGFLILVALRLS
ncbi:DUF3995 domain-containing protein [Devosia aurantiaca]|uniref:DUF3995 domain-containing protein n=1 Tax=Devosia aurantiaca TaxID=2714858 RepID=A0A6M1SRU3_9HYPH|nr:DUF3995 domain-containing protein [Devosia aurantiaca]NGP18102.1 DUF3995 domain-containing protein [Devosia aurantiaca]